MRCRCLRLRLCLSGPVAQRITSASLRPIPSKSPSKVDVLPNTSSSPFYSFKDYSIIFRRAVATASPIMTAAPQATTEELWHQLDDGEKIYAKIWKTSGLPKARIVWLHGFSDHCNTCDPFFPLLASKGIEVFGFDQRGWGRSVKSSKQRGLSGDTKQYLHDVNSVLRRFLPDFPQHSTSRPDNVPVFLMGHSMGGAGVITHASEYPSADIRGYLSASPWIKLPPETQPGTLTVVVGKFAAKFLPHFKVKQPVDVNLLSHDPEVAKTAKVDALCHDTFTLEGANGAITRGEAIDSGKLVVSSKAGVRAFWLGHGTADKVCAFDNSETWFKNCCKVDDKEMKVYDGWYHKSESFFRKPAMLY